MTYYSQVAIDMKNFPHYKSDVDFTSDMVVEQSVFALPASVSFYFNNELSKKPKTTLVVDLRKSK